MFEDLKEEEIVNKVGGRFKLSTLIQKRMVALNKGARPLVDLQTKNLMEIAVAEIKQNKIYLDTSGNVKSVGDDSALVDKVGSLERLLADGGPAIDDL